MILKYHNDNNNGQQNRKDGGTVLNKYTIESIYWIICPAKYTIDAKDKTKDEPGTEHKFVLPTDYIDEVLQEEEVQPRREADDGGITFTAKSPRRYYACDNNVFSILNLNISRRSTIQRTGLAMFNLFYNC